MIPRLAFALLLCSFARGSSLSCFTNFTGLAATDSQAVQLVDETFEQLLDVPAAPAAKRRLAEALAEGKDPYSVPPGDADLITAGKKLSEFREMVERLGWNGPVTRGRLLAAVNRRLNDFADVENRQAATIRNTGGTTTFRLPNAVAAVVSPNDRYLVSDIERSGHPAFTVLDTFTGKSVRYSVDSPLLGFPKFNSDGGILYHSIRHQLRFHPFKEGAVAPTGNYAGGLTRWQAIFGGEPPSLLNTVAAKNPNWVVGQFREQRGLFLFDFEKLTSQKLKGTKHIDYVHLSDGVGANWNIEPGTNRIVTGVREQDQIVVRAGELDAKGKLGPMKKIVAIPAGASNFDVKSPLFVNGGIVILPNHPTFGETTVVPLNGGKPYAFPHIPLELGNNLEKVKYHIHPNGKDVLLEFPSRTLTGEAKVFAVDLNSGFRSGTLSVPGAVAYSLTADGERVIARGTNEITILPWRGRFGGQW